MIGPLALACVPLSLACAGVCVVYAITFGDLLRATPWALAPSSDTSAWREALLGGCLVMPLSCSPHLKVRGSSVTIVAWVEGSRATLVI